MKLRFILLFFTFSIPSLADQREEALRAIADARAAFDAREYSEPPRVSEIKAMPKPLEPFTPREDDSNCASVDFREKLGDVRNQDGVGWCFAYVAADLLTEQSGMKISAVDLALNFYQSGGQSSGAIQFADMTKLDSVVGLKGGANLYAMDMVAQRGVCLESDVRSTDYLQSETLDPKSLLGLTVAKMSKSSKSDKKWLASLLKTIEGFQDVNRNQDALYQKAVCTSVDASQILFPNLSTDTILAAIDQSDRKVDYIRWLQALSCGDKKVTFPDLKYKAWGIADSESKISQGYRFLPKVDELLNQEKPVSFIYNHNFVFPTDANSENTFHASILVGREFRDGQCQYLVRNSFGPSSGYYTRESERGHFWITEEEFHKNTIEIGYIE